MQGSRGNEHESDRPQSIGLFLPFDHAERDLNAKLKPQLHSIHASLELNSEVTATNVTILKTLLGDIFAQMKQTDPFFRLLFKRLEYTGSYYDGLRIKKADEFDINLVLNLPFEKDEFTASDGCPGHVGYEVDPAAMVRLRREGDAKWVPLLLNWMDGSRGRLVPDRVTQWLESVLDPVLRTYVVPSGPCSAMEEIRLLQHGPAVTLYIKLKDGNQIDVDLVPVIEFHHPSWPTSVQKKGWMANMLPEDFNWFLVPKPPMPKSHLWRLHFPNIEKRLIEDHGCVKPIIRLLKAMRDSYGWDLSSYSLKTFVMSQLVANDDAQYWHPDNQGMLFVRVLDCLGHVLAQPGPAISFLFHPEVDLTETITRKTRDNISGQIKRIVRKLWLSPDQCYELVLKNQRKDRVLSDNVDVLLQIKEDILDRISCTTTRAVLALDIKGAFDNVSHMLVFENLASTGCGPLMYDYVRDFLSNCMVTIGVESIRTSTIPPPPLLERIPQMKHTLYADDPTIWTTSGSDGGRQDFLKEVIETVQNYLEAGNLQRAPDNQFPKNKEADIRLTLKKGTPVPVVNRVRILGPSPPAGRWSQVHGRPTRRDNHASHAHMMSRITSHRHGLKESDLIRLTQALVVSRITYANPYLNLLSRGKGKMDLALGVPPYASNAKLWRLGVNNTFQELINTHLASKWEHLALTLSGRHILSSLGIPIPASQCEAVQLLLALRDKIQGPFARSANRG
ncbi:hypothetical protein HPB47_014164 [Ixodes persulcatus]|uniref:Uncharacterized protein n=1 Tax=Ixodes persulcatus TaxID=34615 RepID=A0AC60R263_IXOPE|nr:hypothetical protein HPB47_014164 [Ixodes persulcatus]